MSGELFVVGGRGSTSTLLDDPKNSGEKASVRYWLLKMKVLHRSSTGEK